MRFRFLTLTVLALALFGCSDIKVPFAKSTTGRAPTVAEVPGPEETVRGADDPPVVTLDLGSRLKERRMSRVEELPPNIIIPNTNLTGVPVTAALQAVLAGTEVSLSWEAGAFESRLVSVTNLSGPLPKVVEKVCASAKVFCGYRNGLLEMKEKETFVIDLPAMPTKSGSSGSAANTMADTISDLAGDKVKLDTQGGNLIYTTDVEGHERVNEYLTQLRHGRPLVVMQLYIWEVTLDRDKATGINWNSFKMNKFGNAGQNFLIDQLTTGFPSLASPGISLGAKLAGNIDAAAVLQFLSTQGQVQTISNPQLTFVSGSNAEFKVGGKQRYISQVGTGSSVAGSTSSTTSTSTVSTDSIDTGLKITVGGLLEGDVISAVLDLELQDVISMNPTTMENGTTIDLPETSERKVSTSLRVRPGDNLVLAGLVTSRDSNDRDGIPLPFGGHLNMSAKDELKNSELVVLVKPSVVKFADPNPNSPALQPLPTITPGTDAVMIDKDGPRIIKLPDAPKQPQQLQPGPGAALSTQPTYNVVDAGGQGATVDKSLLQRGFSHAFDDMLEGGASKQYGGVR